ncbi:MAG TPA: hypothetical protein VJC14_03425 [Candidatus Paceibacterota bacterium]
MTDKLNQIIKDELEKLPKESQEAINSLNWLSITEGIGMNFSLTEDEINDLQTETLLALVGLEDPNRYPSNIEDVVGLTREEAEKIATEVTEKIFTLIANAYEKKSPGQNIEGKLDERFEKLPKDIKDAIGESNYQTALYEIAREHKLNIEQMGTLEEYLVSVMLGKISATQFEENIKNKIKLPGDEVQEIIRALNEKILRKIKDKLMAVPPSQINTDESKVLERAGIKIVEPVVKQSTAKEIPTYIPLAATPESKPDLKIPELTAGHIETEIAPVKAPLLAQKFSDSFKIPTVKTEHSTEATTEKSTPATKTYPKGADPYRVIPE